MSEGLSVCSECAVSFVMTLTKQTIVLEKGCA
jgi:hypothetical protein